MLEIRMVRGDILTKTFTLREADGSVYADYPQEIYFTVKNAATDKEYRFQKRLTDGGILWIDDGQFEFTIRPEDTNDLSFSKYAFDIEIVNLPRIKKSFVGDLYIEKEVTHACNEGG